MKDVPLFEISGPGRQGRQAVRATARLERGEGALTDSVVQRVAALRGLREVSRAKIPRAHARGYDVAPRCAGYERRSK